MNTQHPETTIGGTVFTRPNETEIVAVRQVDASRELIWDLWTRPEHVPNWMLGPDGWTMPVCEIDLRPGGTWHFVWRQSNGDEMGMVGEYREVRPPERLVNTENWGGDWPETLNTLVLIEENGKTTMTCTVTYPSEEARDRATETGMLEGWAQSYDRLDEYLGEIQKAEIRNQN